MSRVVCSFDSEPCSDCNPLRLEDRWLHSPTCPVAIGLVRDAAADRAWFAQHPESDERYRPVTWAESVVLRRALVALHLAAERHTVDLTWGAAIRVARDGSGDLTRHFVGDALVLSDSSGDQVAVPDRIRVFDGPVTTTVLGGLA